MPYVNVWVDEADCLEDVSDEDLAKEMRKRNYACGSVDLCARRVGFPIRRPRLFFVAHADRQRQPRRPEPHRRAIEPEQQASRRNHARRCGAPALPAWRDAVGADGNRRLLEPGAVPLIDGAPARVGRLRAYGNAINLKQAAEFISAAREALKVAA
jgi:DNA (cytosine-5)-methyltransferase 1